MATEERVQKALRATRALSIPEERVKPVLKQLLEVFDNEWELIEAENYRALIDACYELEENKEVGDKECSNGKEHEDNKRPSEKLYEGDKEGSNSKECEDNRRSSKRLHRADKEGSNSKEHEDSRRRSNRLHKKDKEGNNSKEHEDNRRCSKRLHKGNKESSDTKEHEGNKRPSKKLHKGDKEGSNCEAHEDDKKPSWKLCKGDKEGSNGKEHKVNQRPSQKLHAIEQEEVPTTDNSIHFSLDDDRRNNLIVADNIESLTIKNLLASSGRSNSSARLIDRKRKFLADITKGTENLKISLVDETGNAELPVFTYIPKNVAYQNAYVHVSLARISDEDCCSSCKGDCLSPSLPCACARETGGEFAYTKQGLLKEEFLDTCISMKEEPDKHPMYFCQECPWEKSKNEVMPESCSGHPIRKFIKECWRKCGCDMQCGNRVVQRGIACKLQVFWTREGKGWGVRTLQDLPKGSFVCEYVGEILTNTELYERNINSFISERHTYPVTLDADWGSEKVLKDEEALCLDATLCGNVARFINHRCCDANLVEVPVEMETPDRHYYHLAFFTTREVKALEELTWDYNIDFHDRDHPIKAFKCHCGSELCRDMKPEETGGSGKKMSKRRNSISSPKQAGEI